MLLVSALLSCAGATPPAAAPPQAEYVQPSPVSVSGPVDLRVRALAAPAGFVALLEMNGEVESAREGSAAPPRVFAESVDAELRFELEPTRAPNDGDFAAVAVLRALRHRTRRTDPASRQVLELADDRLRMLADGKVAFDLRGAQPREKVTPRMLLGQPFALVHLPAGADHPTVAPQGNVPVRNFHRPVPARDLLRAAHVARPPAPVGAGASWSAPRSPLGPLAQLGFELPVEHKLAGFERIGEATCAWILLSAALDQAEVAGAGGQRFERVVGKLRGEAWIDVASGGLVRLELEEDVRAGYARAAAGGATQRVRARYRSGLRVERAAPQAKGAPWGDGSARFPPPASD